MKTLKIITTISTLSLILFLSSTSIAKPVTVHTGDIVKTSAKKQISAAETAISKMTAAVETEFSYLRFDVNKYVNENETAEVTHSSLDYLRFDVTDFMNETEVSEMPSNEFNYLRCDVNNFIENNTENSGTTNKIIFNKVNNPLEALSSKPKALQANNAMRTV